MFAIVAAILFGLALLLDIANVGLGSSIDLSTIVIAGLLFVALHLAGLGHTWHRGWSSRRRRRQFVSVSKTRGRGLRHDRGHERVQVTVGRDEVNGRTRATARTARRGWVRADTSCGPP